MAEKTVRLQTNRRQSKHMEKTFRLAFGKCSSTSLFPRLISREMVRSVLARLERVRLLTLDQISQFQDSSEEVVQLSTGSFFLTTYKKLLGDNGILIVVQGLKHTIMLPNFVSFHSVGHMVTEGLVFNHDGHVEQATDELLWEFR